MLTVSGSQEEVIPKKTKTKRTNLCKYQYKLGTTVRTCVQPTVVTLRSEMSKSNEKKPPKPQKAVKGTIPKASERNPTQRQCEHAFRPLSLLTTKVRTCVQTTDVAFRGIPGAKRTVRMNEWKATSKLELPKVVRTCVQPTT